MHWHARKKKCSGTLEKRKSIWPESWSFKILSMKRSYSFVKPGLRGRTLWSSWFKTANAPQRISPLTAFPPLFQNHCRVLYRLHICWFSTGKERWGVTRTSRWQQCCSNVINVDTSLRNVIYMKSLLPHAPLFENKHALNACWADVLKQWLFFDSADVQVHGIFVFQVCMQIKWVLKLLRCCWKTSDTMAAWTNSCRTRWVCERATRAHTHSATLLWPYSDSPLQLIIFMALAKGTSRIRTGAVTLHTQTAIHIAEQLTQVRNSYSTRLTQMVPVLFASHSFSFNIASLSCPGVWRSTSGHPRVWVELISH